MESRFLKHVNKTDTCWLWTGGKSGDRYGAFNIDGKPKGAHRVAYELWKGEIPDGMLVRHKCDVPTCVNPEHLETGTNQDNMDDKVRAGRQSRGEKHGRAKITKEQALDILSRVGQTMRELAEEFGVSIAQICRIINRKRWKDI